jgi:hypothetical protein
MWNHAMPSLIRFATVLGLLGIAVYAGIFSLANFVVPNEREMIVAVPLHPRVPSKPAERAPAPTQAAQDQSRGPRLVTTLEGLPFTGRN